MKMKIKITRRYHFITLRMATGKQNPRKKVVAEDVEN